MEFREIKYENVPEWNLIEFIGKHMTMQIASVDKAGDVEICICEDDEPDRTIFLNQENLKHLITHLQKQVK